MNIEPLVTTRRIVDQDGKPTTPFKALIDAIMVRVGWIKGGIYGQLKDEATIQWNLDKAPCAVVVMGGNRTLANPLNMVAGPINLYRITFVQDATGSRTITWGSAYKFASGVAPALSTAPNAVDEFVFDCDGTNMKLIAGAKDIR